MHTKKSSSAEPRFVFIIGAGRSGTTLVYKTLCLHPQVAWISNYNARIPAMDWLAVLNRMTRLTPRAASRAWFDKGGNAFLHGRNIFLRLVPTPVEGEAIYARCGIPLHPQPDWRITPRQAACLRTVFKHLSNLQRGKVFLSKRTANNRRIPQLLEAFPDARFVHVIRDGRSVARSLLRVSWWPDMKLWWMDHSTPLEWQRKGGDLLELAARTWVEEMQEVETGIRQIPTGQIIELRYESLVANPCETWESISSFIELDNTRGWLKRVLDMKIYDANRRSTAASNEAETQLIERIQADTLKRFGY